MSWLENLPNLIAAGVMGLVWFEIRSARKETETKFLPRVEHDLGCDATIADVEHKVELVKIDVDHQLDIGGRIMSQLDERIEKLDNIIKANSGARSGKDKGNPKDEGASHS